MQLSASMGRASFSYFGRGHRDGGNCKGIEYRYRQEELYSGDKPLFLCWSIIIRLDEETL